MEQVIIAVFGVTAVWLSQQQQASRRRYASILGLVGQPAWFYAAWTTQQWGIFILSFFYTYSWAVGFYNHWLDTGEHAA